jgi:hypothetical protein
MRISSPHAICLLALSSCSGSTHGFSAVASVDSGPSNRDDSGSIDPNDAGSPPPILKGDGGSADGGASCDTGNVIYVVTADTDLYSFDPSMLSFTKIGRLNCSAFLPLAFSMAVDRSGFAWVVYATGDLFKVSTKDATCSATSFAPGQHGFTTFGMGFATNGNGSSEETLFVADSNRTGLGKVDLGTLTLDYVGPFAGEPAGATDAELTGTGDGRLFGFFETSPTSPTQLGQIDKASGTVTSITPLPGVTTGQGYAFAFWGGDFWFFTATQASTDVTRLKTSDRSLTVVRSNVGFMVTGAGVSTCAPVTEPPPK